MKEMSAAELAWGEFVRFDPLEVSRRAGVEFEESLGIYRLRSLGLDMFVSLNRREVYSDSREGERLLQHKDYFFGLSVLWYLMTTRDIPLSGKLVKPASVPGGQIFVKGTHVLPLADIAAAYSGKKELFYEVGARYGGVEADHGDISVRLLPFPRLPVYLIIWSGDEDFAASGQLLLDTTCTCHLSTDVLWAVTTVCCLLFLEEPRLLG